MAIQLILCVETNKKADTDSIYITEALNHYFKIDNTVNINKVFMSTKTKYNSKDIVKEINEKMRLYSFGETKVIYCIDTDNFETNQEHNSQLKEIRKYCNDKHYDLVWFCHNVEEVFLGRTISDKQKTSEARTFRRKKTIGQLDSSHLSSNQMYSRRSNMLDIFAKYLEKK